jgi:AcrR family transcriptional regulator
VDTPVVKPLRADARRNRERLLAVAQDVFARQGTSASTEDIAHAAGVGIGTLFRHFPTKEALLHAVLLARLRQLTDQADQLSRADDPGAAFEAFFTQVIAEARTRQSQVEALSLAGIDLSVGAADVKADFNAALERLLSRAQVAGAVRADIGLAELLALIVGTSRAVQFGGDDPQMEARTVRVVLDGLSAREVSAPRRPGRARPGPTTATSR